MREGQSPSAPNRERDLHTDTEPGWREAAGAALVPLLAVLCGAVGALVADALALTSVDDRFAAVGLGIAAPLLLGHVLRPDAKARLLVGALGLPWLLALFFPRSPIVLGWLAGGILFLGAAAVVRAGRAAWPLGATVPSRFGLALLGAGPGAYFWVAAAIVLVNTLLAVAPVRLGHQRPSVAGDEREVTLHARDGYAIEGTYTEGADGAGAVLLVHGVADGRDRWLPWVDRLRAMHLHVLRIDLRGHGRSDGAFVTYGQRETADVDAGLAWLGAQPGVDRARVAMVGTSMGGGIVLAASERAPVVAAIALAPASSYPRLVAQRTAFLGPLAPFVLNGSAHLARAIGERPMTGWAPAARMSRTLPFLVAHGTEDRTIPIALSRELAASHANVDLYEVRCGHDDIPAATAADGQWPQFRAFLAAHGLGEP